MGQPFRKARALVHLVMDDFGTHKVAKVRGVATPR
jgi:hypothetical protein